MREVIHCLEGFVEASVVSRICVLLSSVCEIGPPLILDLSKRVLEDAAKETEGRPDLLTGHDGWAKWGCWDNLFFGSCSWNYWLSSWNQSLLFLVVNPRTSSDVCKMALFSWSRCVSGEVSYGLSPFSSLDSRSAWKSTFTSSDHFLS